MDQQKWLLDIEEEQKRCNELAKFRVMELSATSRSGGDTLGLEASDYEHPEVKKRIEAKKTIHPIENKEEKKLSEEAAIDDCLNKLPTTYNDQMNTLLTLEFQIFDDTPVLSA